jgi:mono/diheme cytochrome c family protein
MRRSHLIALVAATGGALSIAGCTREGHYMPLGMWNNGRIKPYEGSPRAGEASSVRTAVPGTVARGSLADDDPRNSGRSGGKLLTSVPITVDNALLARGQERFNIYCAPCHGRLGDARGMIVRRGFPPPPDYAIKRLRNAPVGHFYDVMTNGYGVMYSYANRVTVNDRWAISAYIRVLQAARKEVPAETGRDIRERARQQMFPDPGHTLRVPTEGGEAPGHEGAGHEGAPAGGAAPAAGHAGSPAEGAAPAPAGLPAGGAAPPPAAGATHGPAGGRDLPPPPPH